jgi:hypothetical protein
MWNEDSSQHDKCQVGNMHPNSLDLVPFFYHSIIHAITQVI